MAKQYSKQEKVIAIAGVAVVLAFGIGMMVRAFTHSAERMAATVPDEDEWCRSAARVVHPVLADRLNLADPHYIDVFLTRGTTPQGQRVSVTIECEGEPSPDDETALALTGGISIAPMPAETGDGVRVPTPRECSSLSYAATITFTRERHGAASFRFVPSLATLTLDPPPEVCPLLVVG